MDMLYTVLLMLHILGAVVLIGSSMLAPVLTRRMVAAPGVLALRELAAFTLLTAKVSSRASVVVLVAGLAMTVHSWSFGDAWILLSLGVFAVMGALAGTVLDPYAKRVVAAAEAAPDGPVPRGVVAVVEDRRAHRVEALFLPLDIAILFLMVGKPGWAAGGTAVAVALVVGFALSLRGARHPAPAVAA